MSRQQNTIKLRRNLIAITILLALAGLTFVQFRLLVIGAKLEKKRFDQNMVLAKENIQAELNAPNVLSDALITRLKRQEVEPQEHDYLLDSLQIFLGSKMGKEGVAPQFSFAITPRSTKQVVLKSKNFKPEAFAFNEYPVELGNYFSSRLYGGYTLHIDAENLFFYLLRDLDYLIIPSVLCLLAILSCLFFLMKILRREERLNAIKNDFINNLTHELKTPAFGISLATKLARESIQKGSMDKVLEYLSVIETEKDKLVSHAEKVLELASLENGQQHFQKKKTNVHELVLELISDFRPKVESKGGQISVVLKASNPILLVDPAHFRNALLNLLDNALKYSPQKPEIELSTRNVGSALEITVRDHGIGIAEKDQAFVFDKFYRVSSSTDLHQVKGFGLGLSYVKQVVKAHEGKVKVESRMGEGTIFRIILGSRKP